MQLSIHNRALFCSLILLSAAACVARGEADLGVYGDALQNGFEDSYWNSLDLNSSAFVHSGFNAISVSPERDWQGIFFQHAAFDTTPYSRLSFWVHGSTNGSELLQVQGLLDNSNPPPEVYYRFRTQTNAWERISVPLASLGISKQTNCTGFWIELAPSGTTNTFYVDDVQFDADTAAAAGEIASVARIETGANWGVAVWCMVAILAVMAVLLGWLVLMMRGSGSVGSGARTSAATEGVREIGPEGQALPAVIPGGGVAGTEGTAAAGDQQLRERVAWELAEFAKRSLVQGLYSQRSDLMATQEKARQELSALEARLAMLQLPLQERIRTYETRIVELEKELETRDEEMRGMIQATLLLVKERLEQEKDKAKQDADTRFN